MDIYHPVVLFKFSTKRGPSPLLSPPRAADAAFIVGRKRGKEGTHSQREREREGGRHPGSQSAGESREGRMEAREAGASPLLSSCSCSCSSASFRHRETPLARGGFGAERPGRTRIVGTEWTKDAAPPGTKGFPFSKGKSERTQSLLNGRRDFSFFLLFLL